MRRLNQQPFYSRAYIQLSSTQRKRDVWTGPKTQWAYRIQVPPHVSLDIVWLKPYGWGSLRNQQLDNRVEEDRSSQSASAFSTQVHLFLACVLTKDREIALLNQLVSSQLKSLSSWCGWRLWDVTDIVNVDIACQFNKLKRFPSG